MSTPIAPHPQPNMYQFSEHELDCGTCVRWTPPVMEETYRDDHFVVLRVGRHHIAWPAQFSTSDLPWLYNEVFRPAAENPHAYEYQKITISRGDWVVDAGACEGFFTWYALERGANVCIVEPVRRMCDALSVTFAKQILEHRVRIIHGGLGSACSSMRINTDPQHACESHETTSAVTETAPVITVDSLVQYGLIPCINVLKMDIEGAEMAALQGASHVLREMKPKLAIAVYHDVPNAAQCAAIATSAHQGYESVFRGKYNWENCTPRPYMFYAR